MKLYHSQGYLLAGSYDSEIETQHNELVPPHEAFAIVQIEEKPEMMFQIRNPNGRKVLL
jgi:hypothetical protein